jgi:hypothetical protein
MGSRHSIKLQLAGWLWFFAEKALVDLRLFARLDNN